ncbi:hypothetical protein LVJ94_49145 [Pendulispora rubella]|uniref:Uncharacterized protein n=1 Tax=Pendulispora rubella TaxID=2741070 RepID=A0ABZ2L274_9BACT
MDKKNNSHNEKRNDRSEVVRPSLEYLRQRSLHRIWWNSARIALRRGHGGEPLHQPNGLGAIGKRV